MKAAITSMKYQIAFMNDELEKVNEDKVLLDGLTKRFATMFVNDEAFIKMGEELNYLRKQF